MAEEDPSDQDVGPSTAGANTSMPKGRRSFSRMRREMTDDEIAQSGVQKIMMDDLERLEFEKAQIEPYVEKFHLADKQGAVLIEKGKIRVASDICFGSLLTIGAAALGYSSSITAPATASSMVFWIGLLLMIAGVASKVVLK